MKKWPTVVRAARKEDSMMDWEDNMMEWDDLPTLSWSEVLKMGNNREKAKRWRRAKVQRQALLQSLEKKSQERLKMSKWIVEEIMDSWDKSWKSTRTETVVASSNMSWTIAVTHEIGKGGWEKSGSIDAKKHRINWRLSVDIRPVKEIREQEREQHIQELQDWLMDSMEEEIDMSVAAKMFNRGEEEYEHMLMDLQRLSLGVPVVETGNFSKFSQ